MKTGHTIVLEAVDGSGCAVIPLVVTRTGAVVDYESKGTLGAIHDDSSAYVHAADSSWLDITGEWQRHVERGGLPRAAFIGDVVARLIGEGCTDE